MSGVFDVAKQTFLGSGATRLDVDTDTIKCRLVDKTTDYTAYDSTNTSMTPIPKYGASTDQTLANPSIVTASAVVAFDNTADLTFTAEDRGCAGDLQVRVERCGLDADRVH
jgi:hypothetical protein